ncbi:kinase-like protein, partial [Massarina eburnea CBS 473.64]
MASSLHPKEKSLGKVLRDALQHSDFSNREFLPHDAFNDIKKEWDVPQELASRKIDDKDGVLTKFISEKSPKTFAILIRARLGTHAARLAEYGFTDRYLPVQYEHGKITSRSGIPADDPALRWFLTWEEKNNPDADVETNINEFCRHQWEFLAPIFAAGAVIEELHDDHVLPLFEYVQRGGGGFSTLYQARIHKAHRGDLIKVNLAIKELLESESGSENAFDGEVNALDLARSLNHRHIVNFLAAFKWRTKRYMMFQWVDGGNLREFWNNNSRGDEVTIGHTIKWALTELHGLAEALDKWHNYFKDSPRNCRHGDLKPENIIRAKEDGSLGCLQIADLGLAKIHSLATDNRRTLSIPKSTFRYEAPERWTSITTPISRSYDMWSLGCVILEFIIWLLYGVEELQGFNRLIERGFFEINDDHTITHHPKVRQWSKHMEEKTLGEKQGKCYSGALRDLLDMVVKRLL